MDMKRLASEWPVLTSHMLEVGYAESYVLETSYEIVGLLRLAPSLECWDDLRGYLHGTGTEHEGRGFHGPILEIIRQFDEEGILPRTDGARRHVRRGARDRLCEGFAAVLDAYEATPKASRKAKSSLRTELSSAALLLAGLQRLGRTRPDEVTEEDVLSVVTKRDGTPAIDPSSAYRAKKVLEDSGVVGCERLAGFVPVPRKWRKVGDVLSKEESAAVDRALTDPSSGLSLRDRAMGTLLFRTGMRGCDVAALRKDSIDWRQEVIRLSQKKTGTPLKIPLLPSVGNAIFDYVTEERGPSEDPHVFLSTSHPYGRLEAPSVYNVVTNILDSAGVRVDGDKGERGSRLFRRVAATSMIGSGVDRAVAASVLGHVDPSTTDGYMVASVEGLRRHASLDVSRFAIGEGVPRRENS